VGWALFSDRSQIALRMLGGDHEIVDDAFVGRLLDDALAFRKGLEIDATACRLVHGEADRLPSLIVDRYGDYLVVQALSQGIERLTPVVVRHLVTALAPRGVLARNDSRIRLLEGLERRVEVLYGEVPEAIAVRDGAVEIEVDPWKGQKTGLFLDQRENRRAAACYARGRLLDCFSYEGGFALQLAPRCESALAVDSSEEALERLARNASRNGVTIATRAANVFDQLRELERAGARYETIVLDPPGFARNKASVPRALAGYKEINLRAMRLLPIGGFLITCSCSFNVDEGTFASVVHEASVDAGVGVVVVEKRMQARDHPVLLGVPETYYLKCLILRRIR
jgi:23S rRNA (cytosine1962-C5)-methyltransferase